MLRSSSYDSMSHSPRATVGVGPFLRTRISGFKSWLFHLNSFAIRQDGLWVPRFPPWQNGIIRWPTSKGYKMNSQGSPIYGGMWLASGCLGLLTQAVAALLLGARMWVWGGWALGGGVSSHRSWDWAVRSGETELSLSHYGALPLWWEGVLGSERLDL